MEKLSNYTYTYKNKKYVSERIKVDKGIYNFKIFLGKKLIVEKENVKAKTGRDLEKYIRKTISEYDTSTEEIDEIDDTEDIKEGISEVLEEEEKQKKKSEKKQTKETKKEDKPMKPVQNISDIDGVFNKRNSPIEMKNLYMLLDAEIKDMDNVVFKTTSLDLVYSVNGMNFLRIRPSTKTLNILTAPEYYKNIVKLSDKTKIKDAMVSITKSYEFIKKKTTKK